MCGAFWFCEHDQAIEEILRKVIDMDNDEFLKMIKEIRSKHQELENLTKKCKQLYREICSSPIFELGYYYGPVQFDIFDMLSKQELTDEDILAFRQKLMKLAEKHKNEICHSDDKTDGHITQYSLNDIITDTMTFADFYGYFEKYYKFAERIGCKIVSNIFYIADVNIIEEYLEHVFDDVFDIQFTANKIHDRMLELMEKYNNSYNKVMNDLVPYIAELLEKDPKEIDPKCFVGKIECEIGEFCYEIHDDHVVINAWDIGDDCQDLEHVKIVINKQFEVTIEHYDINEMKYLVRDDLANNSIHLKEYLIKS